MPAEASLMVKKHQPFNETSARVAGQVGIGVAIPDRIAAAGHGPV
ncbi:hypothetical protein [Paracidovorax anthurii]